NVSSIRFSSNHKLSTFANPFGSGIVQPLHQRDQKSLGRFDIILVHNGRVGVNVSGAHTDGRGGNSCSRAVDRSRVGSALADEKLIGNVLLFGGVQQIIPHAGKRDHGPVVNADQHSAAQTPKPFLDPGDVSGGTGIHCEENIGLYEIGRRFRSPQPQFLLNRGAGDQRVGGPVLLHLLEQLDSHAATEPVVPSLGHQSPSPFHLDKGANRHGRVTGAYAHPV